MEKVSNFSGRVLNCILNSILFPYSDENILPGNFYSYNTRKEVLERLRTDAFLIAEREGFKRNSCDYFNIAVGHLITDLTNTAFQMNQLDGAFLIDSLYSFLNSFSNNSLTAHLNAPEGDKDLVLRIIEESNSLPFLNPKLL